jgi:hypothetical protein
MHDTLTISQVEARNVERATGLQIPDEAQQRHRLHHRLVQAWGTAGRSWEIGQGVCKVCGAKHCAPGEDFFEATVAGMELRLPTPVCDACSPLVSEVYAVGSGREMLDVSLSPQWDEQCPPRFKEICAMTDLPAKVDSVAFKRLRAWRWGVRGVYAIGQSGSGKTSAYWALARELERAGDRPLCIGAVELGRRLQQAAKDLASVPDLLHARVLMIDDLGKERATPAASSLFSEVLDHRYAHRLPVIITTRFTSKELRARFSEPSIGQDITRRLYEICEGLTFELHGREKPDADDDKKDKTL